MKIKLTPMASGIKEAAEDQINNAVNQTALLNAQKDQEHKAKRDIANKIIDIDTGDVPQEFSDEANLMGLSLLDFAKLIAEKPDDVLERGLRRRADVLAVRNASSPGVIDEILKKYSTPQG